MAPPQRGRDKTQISMLKFTKRSTSSSATEAPRPSSQRPSSQKSPVGELPRSTAPPFFRRKAPKPKRPSSIGSPADDAWEIGERVLRGQKISPRVLYGDERAPAQDSESDFEPETVRHRVAQERPSLKRKHSVSGLRDDRMSMAKRSGSKRSKVKAPIRISTQRSLFENNSDSDGTPKSAAKRSAKSADIGDDCELLLIEGEKLEMSGTEEEDNDASRRPIPSRSPERPRISLAGSVVTPAEKHRTADVQFKTPEEFSVNGQGLLLHCKNAPRKAMHTPTGQTRRTTWKNASGLAVEGSSTRKRACELPNFFDSESDSQLDAPKSSVRKGSRKTSVFDSDSSQSEDGVIEPAAISAGEGDKPRPCARSRRLRSARHSRIHQKASVCDSGSSSPELDSELPSPTSGDEYANARPPRQTRRVVARKTNQKPQKISAVESDSSSIELDDPETVTISSAEEDEEQVHTPEQTRSIVTRSSTKKIAQPKPQKSTGLARDLLDLGDDTLSGQENRTENNSRAGSMPRSRTRRLSITPEATPSPPSTKQRRYLGRPENPAEKNSRADSVPPSATPELSTTPESTPPPPSTKSRRRFGHPENPSESNSRADSVAPSATPKLSITPESTPSPPSTKKRKRRGRLISNGSDEEIVHLGESDKQDLAFKSPKIPESTKRDVELQSASKAGPRSEWFLERQIDEFSSSSADLRALSSQETKRPSDLTKRRQMGRKRTTVLPVRRDIFKGLESDRAERYGRLSPGNTPTQSPGKSPKRDEPRHVENDSPQEDFDEVVDLVDDDEGESPIDLNAERDSPLNVDEIRNSSSVAETDEVLPVDDGKPPPFNLLVLCNRGENVKQMKERLGEEALMDRVIEAQQAGREIIGGEEVGLTSSFNRNVFNRFSREVVGDQLGRERKAKVVTEQALRGEYQFNYRGRNQTNKPFRGKGARKNTRGGKKARGSGRLSNLRRRLG